MTYLLIAIESQENGCKISCENLRREDSKDDELELAQKIEGLVTEIFRGIGKIEGMEYSDKIIK